MTRDKAYAMLVFIGFAWLASFGMMVWMFVEALRNPDNWTGFVGLLLVTLLISVGLVMVLIGLRRSSS
ncbi:hypothetical protein ABZS66_28575 [Dactylosporangium sp. NPDC005572]|uniref:hypothetical protein n=1 Tax=Dactylosporangium sp. NPDC005572 TaxID=3156889 RepID=UPI0033A44E78